MQLDRLKQNVNDFLVWWGTGLAYLLPTTLRDRVRYIPNRLIIELHADQYQLKLVKTGVPAVDVQSRIQRADMTAGTAVLTWPDETADPDTLITFIVPPDQVLVKPLVLPLTAAGNLHEVLRFEMDRQTPFTAEQVYYAWRELKRDTINNKLHIELLVVLKDILDPVLQELARCGLTPHAVTVAATSEVNLLPPHQRASRDDHDFRLTQKLALITVCLLLAALYLPQLRQDRLLSEAEAQVAELREQAREVETLIQERDQLLARAQFLDQVRQTYVPAIDVLNEMTQLLPDSTWLSRLMVRSGEIQLYGESETAAALIPLLDNSALFADVQFRAPVTKNTATGKDQFQLSATLNTAMSQ